MLDFAYVILACEKIHTSCNGPHIRAGQQVATAYGPEFDRPADHGHIADRGLGKTGGPAKGLHASLRSVRRLFPRRTDPCSALIDSRFAVPAEVRSGHREHDPDG